MADNKPSWFADALASVDTDELGNFIFKHFYMRGTPMKKTITALKKLSQKRDDKAMVERLRKPVPFDANANFHRNTKRSREIRSFFDEFAPPARDVYLDIGCNNGEITCLTGEGFGRVVGTDVEDTRSPITINNFEFHLAAADGTLPLADSSADVVTAIQVLHHVRDQDKMISEIHRVLKPGGILVLREQDLAAGLKTLFDLEHLVYDCIKNNMPYDTFIANYYSNFRSADEWEDMLEKIGLKELVQIREDSRRFGRYYYAVYRK
jgi:ubiquinone/menaquinone biosynthesis C-methylase UbiE